MIIASLRLTPLTKASIGLVCAVGALSGCSQLEGLATNGNMNVVYLETASTNILLSQKVPLQSKPVCNVSASTEYNCNALTVSGEPITVNVPGTDDDPIMTIKVNGSTIYTGSVETVISQYAQAPQ